MGDFLKSRASVCLQSCLPCQWPFPPPPPPSWCGSPVSPLPLVQRNSLPSVCRRFCPEPSEAFNNAKSSLSKQFADKITYLRLSKPTHYPRSQLSANKLSSWTRASQRLRKCQSITTLIRPMNHWTLILVAQPYIDASNLSCCQVLPWTGPPVVLSRLPSSFLILEIQLEQSAQKKYRISF